MGVRRPLSLFRVLWDSFRPQRRERERLFSGPSQAHFPPCGPCRRSPCLLPPTLQDAQCLCDWPPAGVHGLRQGLGCPHTSPFLLLRPQPALVSLILRGQRHGRLRFLPSGRLAAIHAHSSSLSLIRHHNPSRHLSFARETVGPTWRLLPSRLLFAPGSIVALVCSLPVHLCWPWAGTRGRCSVTPAGPDPDGPSPRPSAAVTVLVCGLRSGVGLFLFRVMLKARSLFHRTILGDVTLATAASSRGRLSLVGFTACLNPNTVW